MADAHELLLFRGDDEADPLATARALNRWLEEDGDGSAPVPGVKPELSHALADVYSVEFPDADLEDVPDAPGEYTVAWPDLAVEAEIDPFYVAITLWPDDASEQHVDMLRKLVELAADAGYTRRYDAERDHLVDDPTPWLLARIGRSSAASAGGGNGADAGNGAAAGLTADDHNASAAAALGQAPEKKGFLGRLFGG